MKRLLLLSTVHPPTDPRIVYKIAPSLAKEYEVFMALPGTDAISPPAGVVPVRLPRFRRLLFRLVFSHPVMLWKCLRLRPDIVHVFVPELLPTAFLFRWLGAEVIYEVQENLHKKLSLKRYNNAWVFRYLFCLFDHLARKHFHCILTEDAYRNEYEHLAYPSVVVHNFAALPFLDSLPKHLFSTSAPPIFFYSGVISMERSFDTLVAAVAILREIFPDVEVHLFGPVRFSHEEMAALPSFGTVKSHLTFYGYTDQRIALAHATRAVAGLALLKPVGDYPDSYTTKLFEYMALKIPVVTSDFPLYRNVVETHECGFCLSPYDAQSLAETLEWLIRHPAARQAMGERGRRAVEEHYNWAREECVLVAYYHSILERPSLP